MNLRNAKIVGIDTNIFIYQFSRHPVYFPIVKEFFQLLEKSKIKGVTSIATLTELLSFPRETNNLAALEETFFSTPNLTILNLERNIAKKAADIRRSYGFRSPDAFQLATALDAKADTFLTNDKQLKKFKELKIQLLSETN